MEVPVEEETLQELELVFGVGGVSHLSSSSPKESPWRTCRKSSERSRRVRHQVPIMIRNHYGPACMIYRAL